MKIEVLDIDKKKKKVKNEWNRILFKKKIKVYKIYIEGKRCSLKKMISDDMMGNK